MSARKGTSPGAAGRRNRKKASAAAGSEQQAHKNQVVQQLPVDSVMIQTITQQVLLKLQDNVLEQAGDRGCKCVRDTDVERKRKRRRSPSDTDFSDSESNSDSSVTANDSDSESDQEDAKQHLVSAPISSQVDAKLKKLKFGKTNT